MVRVGEFPYRLQLILRHEIDQFQTISKSLRSTVLTLKAKD